MFWAHVLGTGDLATSKTDKIPALIELIFPLIRVMKSQKEEMKEEKRNRVQGGEERYIQEKERSSYGEIVRPEAGRDTKGTQSEGTGRVRGRSLTGGPLGSQ